MIRLEKAEKRDMKMAEMAIILIHLRINLLAKIETTNTTQMINNKTNLKAINRLDQIILQTARMDNLEINMLQTILTYHKMM